MRISQLASKYQQLYGELLSHTYNISFTASTGIISFFFVGGGGGGGGGETLLLGGEGGGTLLLGGKHCSLGSFFLKLERSMLLY